MKWVKRPGKGQEWVQEERMKGQKCAGLGHSEGGREGRPGHCPEMDLGVKLVPVQPSRKFLRLPEKNFQGFGSKGTREEKAGS